MNAIIHLYGNIDQWNAMADKFLTGSFYLTDSPAAAANTSSEATSEDKGYYCALKNAVAAGINREPLTCELIELWRELILEEMKARGILKEEDLSHKVNPYQIQALLKEIGEKLSFAEEQPNEIYLVSLLGDITYLIEAEHSFYSLSRPMAHLVMSYLTSYFRNPLIIFNPKDRDVYLSAISNKLKMRLLLVEKVREAVIVRGDLFTRVGGKFASERYKALGQDSRESLIIQWHDLLRAAKSWERELAEKTEIGP